MANWEGGVRRLDAWRVGGGYVRWWVLDDGYGAYCASAHIFILLIKFVLLHREGHAC